MEKINIHTDIEKKLKYFIEIKKIPNIIFHGVSGCGKNTLVKNFIHDIYQDDKETIKNSHFLYSFLKGFLLVF